MKINNLMNIVKIKCPECNSIEDAEVEFGILWNTYIHECKKCNYLIMESEWEEEHLEDVLIIFNKEQSK